MAVEEVDPWIIGHKADSRRSASHNQDSVAAHGRTCGRIYREERTAGVPADDLEVVSVEMERMREFVMVVDD
jgi:hypothetical protein